MRAAILALVLACAVASAGCGDDDDVPTEVIVRIDAQEGVKEEFNELKVLVEGLSEDGGVSEMIKTKKLPFVLGLRPERGDAQRAYRVTATALNGDGNPIAEARFKSQFVEGERRYVVLQLEDACRSVTDCGRMLETTCHAAPGQDLGTCVDAEIDPGEFGTDESDPPTVGDLIDERSDPVDPDGGTAGVGMIGGGGGSSGIVAPILGGRGGRGGNGAAGTSEGAGEGAGAGGTASSGCDSDPDCPPLLSGLEVTAGGGESLLAPSFDPEMDEYDVYLPLASGHVDIVATVAKGLHLVIDGQEASFGATVSSHRPAGRSEFTVVVSNDADRSTTYTLVITRGRQIRYLKPTAALAGTFFGTALAISGDRIVVARDTKPGSAIYLFEESGAVWDRSDPATLDLPAADRFGSAVAMAGSVMLVGAASIDAIGTAYVYEGGPSASARLMGTQGGDGFGSSVAIGADTIAIGAPVLGTMTIFKRSTGGEWSPIVPGPSSNGSGDFNYGRAVAVSPDGNLVAVGSPGGADSDSGAVYVFQRADNVWTLLPTVPMPGGPPKLGSRVALANDMLLASAFDDADGAVYAFRLVGSDWVGEPQRLRPKMAVPTAHFGSSLALSGDLMVVGAPYESSGAKGVFPEGQPEDPVQYSHAGAAYVFMRSGNEWTEQAYLKANNVEEFDEFGGSVAISNGVIVVGARYEDSGHADPADEGTGNANAKDSGAAYVFR